jgi:hypothetical protein
VALHFLRNGGTPTGGTLYLTDAPGTDHVNVHVAPYGRDELLVSWETVSAVTCAAGTCRGTFTGTHVELVTDSGKAASPAVAIPEHISGDIAVLPNGNLTWAYVAARPDDHTALGASPGTETLRIATLHVAS